MAYDSADDFDFKFVSNDFAWEDIVSNVIDLIRINTLDTMEDDEHYTIDDISTVMSNEYDMIKENLDQDIYQMWEKIHNMTKKELEV